MVVCSMKTASAVEQLSLKPYWESLNTLLVSHHLLIRTRSRSERILATVFTMVIPR